MKERPILYSRPMIRPTMDGTKTQTRRIGKIQSPAWTEIAAETVLHATKGLVYQATYRAYPDGGTARWAICEGPYGVPGDRLWVREEHFQFGHWEPIPGVRTKTDRQKWRFVADTSEVRYMDNPPDAFRKGMHRETPEYRIWHKRLARFMPRRASRITLEIVSVRAERLQDISEADAKAEGILQARHNKWWGLGSSETGATSMLGWTPVEAYKSLWESINGPGSWDLNQWVWVVEFKKLEAQP